MKKFSFEPSITMGNLIQMGILVVAISGYALSTEHTQGRIEEGLTTMKETTAALADRTDRLENAESTMAATIATEAANQSSVVQSIALLQKAEGDNRSELHELEGQFMNDLQHRVHEDGTKLK